MRRGGAVSLRTLSCAAVVALAAAGASAVGDASLAMGAGASARESVPPRASGGSISQRLAQILDALPSDALTTGVLADRVVQLAPFADHDGSPAAKPATGATFRQLLSQYLRASGAENPRSRIAELDRRARDAARGGVVPIAVLDFRYDRVRPEALATGALVIRDGRLVPGPGGAPCEVGRVFAAAALRDRTFHGEAVTFRVDGADWFGDSTARPVSLEIDFDDGGGFVGAVVGRETPVRYATPGRKAIRVRRAEPGGALREAAFFIEVARLRTPAPSDTMQIQATLPYLGGYGTGQAYVYLADGHAALTQPVIVIEGFDLDNSMGWDELYELLNRQELLETLRADGFDAVVLDFTDAVDYIQRNAFVAVELIERVRAVIAPQSTIAVAGASMGGLVGRYALAYMETHGRPHGARTFISFDAPQNGADIPLGMQYWLWFFADQSPEAAAMLASLDAPAARQMLAYHHTDPPGTTGQSDPLRAELLSDFNAVGEYPALPRRVAIINGSGQRADQGFSAGEQIILWEYTSWLIDITGNVWAVPDGTSQLIFHGLIDIILLPEEEVLVTVSGTRPFDNAPGGWRGSMAELGATAAPYGDIVALYPNHCFIPSVSGLHVDTEDLFYDIAGDPDLLSHTPFDAVYFPAANEEHVEITPATAAWFIAEVELGASAVATGAPGAGAARAAAAVVEACSQPITPSSRLRLSVPHAGRVRLFAYDASGRTAAVLLDRDLPEGAAEVAWRDCGPAAGRLAAGVYLLELRGAGFHAARKVVVR